MKKILTLALLILASNAFAQTSLKLSTKNDEAIEIMNSAAVDFNYDDRTFSVYGDEVEKRSFDDFKSLSFTRDGMPWNLRWKAIIPGFHYSFGYGFVMHVRDLMTEDAFRTGDNYNWFGRWERNITMGKESIYTAHVFNVMRILTLGANEWIEALSFGTPEQRGWLGAAFASRAMAYLDMARMYEFLPNDRTSSISALGADVSGLTVPLIDELSTSDNMTNFYMIPRATKAQAVAFIERDLQRAEKLIVELDEPSHKAPHLDVVYGLMARLYLWNEDYLKARLYARKAIDTTASHVMTAEEMTSSQKGFNDLNCWMWGVQNSKLDVGVQSKQMNWTAWMSNEYAAGYGFLANLMINKSLYDRIADTDVRKQLFVAPQGSPLYGQQVVINPDASKPYASLKFRPNEGNIENAEIALPTAYPLMRVEEMYFIEAEAAAHQSPAEGASLLQSFMSKYRNPEYSCQFTDESVIDEIILQKRIELWGEGQTFFDVKRRNMSVTRDYEGTNFPADFRINTQGRPAWMNFVFPRTEETYNLSLTDMNNPDPSDCYKEGWTGPMTDEEARQHVSGSIVLQEPRFKADLPYVPVTAVSYFLLHYDAQVQANDVTLTYTPQISLSPDFPQNEVAPVNFPLSSSSLFSTVRFLQEATGKEISGGNFIVYLRVCGRVNQALSYSLYSNTVSFGVKMPEVWPKSSEEYETTDYLPTATITPVESLDFQKLAEYDRVKACDVTLHGEGELKHFNADYSSYSNLPIGYQMKYPEDVKFVGAMSVDQDGYADNTEGYLTCQVADPFLYEGTEFRDELQVRLSGRYWVQRNDLARSYTLEEQYVIVKPDRQLYLENTYNWDYNAKQVPLTSTLDPERFSGTVSIQQSISDPSVYRVMQPYAKRHNLLFHVSGETDVDVPAQYAYTHENGQAVYVSGKGQYAMGLFDMQLNFYYEDGTAVGSFNEQFGEKSEWHSLGRGLITDDIVATLFNLENVSWRVEIQESYETPGYYRLLNPYTSEYPYNGTGDYDGTQDYYLYIHAEDPDAVWFERQDLGLNWGYGMMFTWSRAHYLLSGGLTPEEVKEQGWYGKMENGVISFPVGGVLFGMEAYRDGAIFVGNQNGLFTINLPEGYQRKSSHAKGMAKEPGSTTPKTDKVSALMPVPSTLSDAGSSQSGKAKPSLREDARLIE